MLAEGSSCSIEAWLERITTGSSKERKSAWEKTVDRDLFSGRKSYWGEYYLSSKDFPLEFADADGWSKKGKYAPFTQGQFYFFRALPKDGKKVSPYHYIVGQCNRLPKDSQNPLNFVKSQVLGKEKKRSIEVANAIYEGWAEEIKVAKKG